MRLFLIYFSLPPVGQDGRQMDAAAPGDGGDAPAAGAPARPVRLLHLVRGQQDLRATVHGRGHQALLPT